jgi:hypothetical protein
MKTIKKTGQALPYTPLMLKEACVLLEQDVVAGSVLVKGSASLNYKEWKDDTVGNEADLNQDIIILP